MLSVLNYIANVGIVFGGLLPYIPQYLDIYRSRNSEGFSTYVCLTLLVANISRILFWFGHEFELPLLIQSFVMSFMMLALLHLCVSTQQWSVNISKQRTFQDFKISDFWQWTDFFSYVQCMCLFALIMSSLTYVFQQSYFYIETIGFIALLTEAILGVPQFLKNYNAHSTQGMSIAMVLLWTIGDIFKTLYFFIKQAPLQFATCGILQILIDLCILLQVFVYPK